MKARSRPPWNPQDSEAVAYRGVASLACGAGVRPARSEHSACNERLGPPKPLSEPALNTADRSIDRGFSQTVNHCVANAKVASRSRGGPPPAPIVTGAAASGSRRAGRHPPDHRQIPVP